MRPEMRKTKLSTALDGLRDENPKRFVSLVRMAWPDIRVALDRGHTVKVIHDRFVAAGVRISYRLFAMYVGQLRRENSGYKALDLEPLQAGEHSPDKNLLGIGDNGLALMQVPKRRLFSTKAASRYLGIDERTLKKVTDRGDIRARRMGTRRVYELRELDSYIESLPRLPRAS